MGSHTYAAAPKLTWPKDAPLAGRMTIVHAVTGEVLYEGESREIKDGETLTISWTRNDDG